MIFSITYLPCRIDDFFVQRIRFPCRWRDALKQRQNPERDELEQTD
ncbi:MAG: hypothetical protein R3F37_02135 [Candidatus Competibacteraceae bacterium]